MGQVITVIMGQELSQHEQELSQHKQELSQHEQELSQHELFVQGLKEARATMVDLTKDSKIEKEQGEDLISLDSEEKVKSPEGETKPQKSKKLKNKNNLKALQEPMKNESKTESVFWTMCYCLSYFYMVSAWDGYVFIINLIPLHVFVLILMQRYSKRVYIAYSIFYIVGLILSMQIPFVLQLEKLKTNTDKETKLVQESHTIYFETFPVMETTDPQGQVWRRHSRFMVKEIKAAVAQYGATAPYTLAIVEAITEGWLTPSDWQTLA